MPRLHFWQENSKKKELKNSVSAESFISEVWFEVLSNKIWLTNSSHIHAASSQDTLWKKVQLENLTEIHFVWSNFLKKQQKTVIHSTFKIHHNLANVNDWGLKRVRAIFNQRKTDTARNTSGQEMPVFRNNTQNYKSQRPSRKMKWNIFWTNPKSEPKWGFTRIFVLFKKKTVPLKTSGGKKSTRCIVLIFILVIKMKITWSAWSTWTELFWRRWATPQLTALPPTPPAASGRPIAGKSLKAFPYFLAEDHGKHFVSKK